MLDFQNFHPQCSSASRLGEGNAILVNLTVMEQHLYPYQTLFSLVNVGNHSVSTEIARSTAWDRRILDLKLMALCTSDQCPVNSVPRQ